MVCLTFIKPEPILNYQTKVIEYSLDKTWMAIYNKSYYLNSKKEITKYTIFDTTMPRWTEHYSSTDSVENKTIELINKKKFCYSIINKKYEQVNGIAIRIDSIGVNQTKLSIAECSQYFNSWASIYFKLFHPNTVIDYEFVKIKNTLQFIDNPTQ
jgi:hypothetical protein